MDKRIRKLEKGSFIDLGTIHPGNRAVISCPDEKLILTSPVIRSIVLPNHIEVETQNNIYMLTNDAYKPDDPKQVFDDYEQEGEIEL